MGCNCPAEKNDVLKERDFSKYSSIQNGGKFDSPSDLNTIIKSNRDSQFYVSAGTKDTNGDNKFKEYKMGSPPLLELSTLLLNEINMIRTNPQEYIPKVEKQKNKIVFKNERFLLDCSNGIFITLHQGPSAFDESINYLKKATALLPLIPCDELVLDVPSTDANANKFTSLDYIQNILTEKTNDLIEFKICGFHYDKSTNNPELSAVLQIVDDTNSNFTRRGNIMNKDATHIGITSCCIKESVYCFYLVFGVRK